MFVFYSIDSVLRCSRLVKPFRAERATTCALLARSLTKARVGRISLAVKPLLTVQLCQLGSDHGTTHLVNVSGT